MTNLQWEDLHCDVADCDRPLVAVVQDLKEKPGYRKWIEWERDGAPHCFCARHRRWPKMTRLTEVKAA